MRGLPVDVLIRFAGTLMIIGGLFVKRPTVYTATQFCLRQEMQQEASDEAIVVTEVSVMGMERRASVIQSELFLNNTDD